MESQFADSMCFLEAADDHLAPSTERSPCSCEDSHAPFTTLVWKLHGDFVDNGGVLCRCLHTCAVRQLT